MKIFKITIILFIALIFWGCKKEAQLMAEAPTEFYKIPQGNSGTDQTIVGLYEKFNTYFLYKFNPSIDFAWTQTAVTSDKLFGNEFSCDPGDENYISGTLGFLEKNWLNFYPDSILKKALPLKVLLAQNLKRIGVPASTNRPLGSTSISLGQINTVTGFNHITINNFSSAFNGMTAQQLANFKSDLHVEFWNYILVKNRLDIPSDFATVSNYTLTVTTSTMYANGFIDTYAKAQTNPVIYDLRTFIKAITSNSKADLELTILKSTNDTKGFVRLKYNSIISFYKSKYNIDLQKIGDTALIP